MDLKQSINDLLRFCTKNFPGESTEVFATVRDNDPGPVAATLKDAKAQARRLILASANYDLINAIVECAINTLNGSNKLTKDEKMN